MLIGIDLLWVRPGRCGGTESYIRNLLTGFGHYDTQNEYLLFTTEDNSDSFKDYRQYPHMRLEVCPISCEVQSKRILWENQNLDKYARRAKVDIMFIPVYSKPYSRAYDIKGGIPYVSVIHDLQALHYPQYFSGIRNLFLRHAWKHTCKTSACVITDSDYCQKDILKHYRIRKEQLKTIYVPICSKHAKDISADAVLQKYSLGRGEYDYCVSSLLPHKNLNTILQVVSQMKKKGLQEYLVLSGVGGNARDFADKLKELGIEKNVIQTGFVTNEERDCLYKGCRLFLFPSVFEGFGMPPIEAMRMGKRVVMTKESCLYEVTDGKAVYVDDPYSTDEWIKQITYAAGLPEQAEPFPQYELEHITRQYIHQFELIHSEKKGRSL